MESSRVWQIIKSVERTEGGSIQMADLVSAVCTESQRELAAARETERDRCAGIADLYPALVGHEIADKIRLANRQPGEAKL